MFESAKAFNSFSVPDIADAKRFYGGTLGLSVAERSEGLEVKLPGGGMVFLYPSSDNVPASFTVLNFVVDDIDAAVDALAKNGVTLERYPTFPSDEKGVVRNDGRHPGPYAIAWFKDPAGNVLSAIQEHQ